MGTPAVQLIPEICSEKKHLASAYVEALRAVMHLQDRQLAALAADGKGLDRFELALTRARQLRDSAKRAYLLHIETHAC